MIFELRQYTLRAGAREILIDLFDREFVDSQEALGSYVLGQFRDLDRPDHFVWMRAFADMETRLRALTEFYGGPVWKLHREAANATMIDTDDVYLLRGDEVSAPRVEVDFPASTVTVVIASMASPIDDDLFETAAIALAPVTSLPGVRHFGTLRTERAENNYPALPVRAGEDVVVCLLAYDGMSEPPGFAGALADAMALLGVPVSRLRLQPTNRSRLR